MFTIFKLSINIRILNFYGDTPVKRRKYNNRLPESWHFESFYLRDEKSWFHFVTSRWKESMCLIVWNRIYNINPDIVVLIGQNLCNQKSVGQLDSAYVRTPLRLATSGNQSYEIRNLSSIEARRSTVTFWLKSEQRKLTFPCKIFLFLWFSQKNL